MPPRRRHQAAQSAQPSQPTLSFNNKSRVTKPSLSEPSSKKAQSKLHEPTQAEVTEITITTTPEPQNETIDEPERASTTETTNVAIRDSPQKTKSKPKSEPKPTTSSDATKKAISSASKITDAQIKKYWQAEESSRLAPRVHQQQLSLHEKILRHFDLSSQYGPCIGIPRRKRWHRAHTLGLDPPVEVLAVLLKEEEKEKQKGIKSSCGKLAYIDELAGGRVVLVE